MNIQPNRTKTLVIQNKKVKGFTFASNIIHGTINTDLANSDFLPENIIISLKLERNGKTHTLLGQGNLKVLHLATNFYAGSFEKSAANMAAAAATVLLEKGVSAYEKWLFELSFNFHGVIDLKGRDTLTLEVNYQSAAVSANVNQTTSFMEVNEVTDQWAYEEFTPTWDITTIQGSESKIEKTFSNLRDLYLINIDKTGILDADAVATQIALTSKMQSYVDTYATALTKRMQKFPTKATSDARLQSFDLYDGDVSPEANLVLTLTSGNVTANKNFIVGCTAYTSARLLENASARQDAHTAKKLIRAGIPAGSALAGAESRVKRFGTR